MVRTGMINPCNKNLEANWPKVGKSHNHIPNIMWMQQLTSPKKEIQG